MLTRGSRALFSLARTMSADAPLTKVAVVQLSVVEDKEKNFQVASDLVKEAAANGARMVFLPECFDYISSCKQQALNLSESITGDIMTRYRRLAADTSVWLSLGGFHETPADFSSDRRVNNSHLLLSAGGELAAVYHKTHMFDLSGYNESDYVRPGAAITPPVDTPAGRLGLGICYDLRFPEFSLALSRAGAQILTFPSAFTVPTGTAHWHVLLRSRAIETQCYVIAAAQEGRHNEKRTSYGHSVVVDPWGEVIAERTEPGAGVIYAEVDLTKLRAVRDRMPLAAHTRADLYQISPSNTTTVPRPDPIPSWYQFGEVRIASKFVFATSPLSIAFVNLRPVLPAHVLVIPRRLVKRFRLLSPDEVGDMFQLVQRIGIVLEKEVGGSSLTVSLQDGKEAGQSVSHVHCHVIPRREGDLQRNDEIYERLDSQKADREMPSGFDNENRPPRSDEEMEKEAARLRELFK